MLSAHASLTALSASLEIHRYPRGRNIRPADWSELCVHYTCSYIVYCNIRHWVLVILTAAILFSVNVLIKLELMVWMQTHKVSQLHHECVSVFSCIASWVKMENCDKCGGGGCNSRNESCLFEPVQKRVLITVLVHHTHRSSCCF